MSTKAENLIFLKKYQKKYNYIVPKILYFTKKKFLANKNQLINQIRKNFKKKKIILRSSSLQEDNSNKSNAGKFKSFSNLNSNDTTIDKKILSILEDFNKPKDQVIAQEFIESPDTSGVIFTRNINNNSPYYFINIDNSGRTDLITSGQSNPSMETIVCFKNTSLYKLPKKVSSLLNVIKKIEKIFDNDRLDIEFCIKNKKIYIFQCRPLKKMANVNDSLIQEALKNITMKIEKQKRYNPLLIGEKTFFSNMADWNPAEMIGNRPSILSLSLYSELITDFVWAQQRNDYGYNNLCNFPLMLNFGGSPYIDLRVDFNSFLPRDLDFKIQNKIIKFYLNKIHKNNDLHDKIEFNVIETCYDFETENKLKKFLSNKDRKKYSKQLKLLTNNILQQKLGNFNKELSKIENLNNRIKIIQYSNLSEIQKIFFLIKNCKELGTLPFSGLARSAFIATRFLKTLQSKKILSIKEIENFYGSINTITNKINFELSKSNNLNRKKKFLESYGHLRPSTYSITSKNYKENFNNYFPKKITKISKLNSNFNLKKKSKLEIDKLFKKYKIKTNCKNFFRFSHEAIRLREYSKFIFTKCINQIFENLISLGKEINIKREDMEYISIRNIINFYNNVEGAFKLKIKLKKEIKENKKNSKLLNLIEFPDFINDKNDIYIHTVNRQKGNYVTSRKTYGPIIDFSKQNNYKKLPGSIVLLKNADPGYDFIFSKNIKGLITEYGGANSHMSIRCLELGIPAIIGIGSKEFNFLRTKKIVEINAFQKLYRVLN